MRSKGSRFSLGVWGLRVCSLDVAFTTATVRNRSQPFATVRNRSQQSAWGLYGRAYGKFCKRGHFWRLRISRCFVSRGRCGTSWHSDVCRKLCCVAGAILLRRFQKMSSSFRGRCSTLETSIVILRGRGSTLDVSCCVFCANRIVRAASSGDKVQIPLQAWRFVRGDENWRTLRTKHRFWRFIRKIVGKRRVWSFKVWKLEEVSHEMLVLMLQRVSSRVFGFPVASPCLWGKLPNLSFSKVSKQVVICTLWHSNLFDNVSKVVLCGRRSTLAPFSQDELQFSWQAQHFGDFHRHFAWQAQHCRRVHCVLYIPRSALRALHSTLYTSHSTLYIPQFTLHFPLYTLHSTLYTPHSTLHTVHSTFHTSHSTLHTLHSTLNTLHSTLRTSHSTLWHSALCTVLCTLYTVHCTLHTRHFTLHTLHFTLYTPHSTLHTPHSTLHTLHSTLHTSHFTLCTAHSTLHTPHSTLYTLHSHSTLHTLQFTLHTLHFKLHTPHTTLYTLNSTLHTLHFTLYTLHSTLHAPYFALHPLSHSRVYSALVR